MAEAELTSRLSSEGRIVIPAEFRRRLNLHPGDVIHFGFDPDTSRLEIFAARHLIDLMWSNNYGGDAVDSVDAVRLLRQDDQQAVEESEARLVAVADEPWDEQAETARLLAALHLA